MKNTLMKKNTFLSYCFYFLMTTLFWGQTVASYDITFTSIWNATDHTSLPPNAHWSRLVGATHKTENTFFEIGMPVSTGIKDVAEKGDNEAIENEINIAIGNSEADQYIFGNSLGTAAGTITISNISVHKDFPLISLVSMIAPSPDWFVGLNSFSLLDNTSNWINSTTIDVYAYDAGTDSGINYTSVDLISNPIQNSTLINATPINGNKIGTISFTLKSVLSIPEIKFSNEISFYQNTTTNELTINNIEQFNLNQIQIFDMSGSILFSEKKNYKTSNSIQINLPDLKGGIYIIKLSSEKEQVSKKIIIK